MVPANDPITDAARVVKDACSTTSEIDTPEIESIEQHLPNANFATRVGYVLHLQSEFRAAIAAYRHALALDEERFDTWYALGCAELSRGGCSQAVECFRRALALRPDHFRTHFDLARALFRTGQIDAAIDSFRIAAQHQPDVRRAALANIACIIPQSPGADNEAILKARHDWAALEEAAEQPLNPVRSAPPGKGKLRLGYLSAFFGNANWLKPVWGVINHHDRSRHTIFLISDGQLPTEDCGYRPHPSDQVIDARKISNRVLAAKIAELGIDVLVDLNAYSFQSRLGLFMHRPAPAIIGWFNTYATTGIGAFDFIVGDDAVIPSDEERFYSERVLRVPRCYLAFSVLYPVPEVVAPPCALTGQITFGSFASQYKLTDEVITAWATLLNRAPSSRLLLKNLALGNASNRVSLYERFRQKGVQPERLLLEGPAEHYRFLEAYAKVDVALDTFPYNGGTTTTEALWAGVPVLSFNGDRWVGRTSRTLLLAAGLKDWCLADLNSYLDKAVALASSPDTPGELTTLRKTMRARLRASPVCDSAGLCRALERLYQQARITKSA
jgi:protein O-GlcNAc transferase